MFSSLSHTSRFGAVPDDPQFDLGNRISGLVAMETKLHARTSMVYV